MYIYAIYWKYPYFVFYLGTLFCVLLKTFIRMVFDFGATQCSNPVMGWVGLEWNQKVEMVYCDTWLPCISCPGLWFRYSDDFKGQVFYYIARETQKRLGFREMEQFASKGTRVFFCFTMEIILCLPFFKKLGKYF